MNKGDEQIYAKVFNPDDYKELGLNSIEYFQCDYIVRCVDGPYEGRQVRLKDLDDEIIIGSEESCNFYIKDVEISGKHCKLSYIPNSIYYSLRDLNSEAGTWLKLSSFEDGLEVKEKTYFKIFQHVFEIYEKNGDHYLNFIEGSRKGNCRKLESECNLTIGKNKVMIDLDMQCGESHNYVIIRRNGRVFVVNKSEEITNNGLFYRICSNDDNDERITLIRAGDIIKIGNCSLRIISHNWGIFSEIGDRPHQEDKHCIVDDLRIFDDVIIPYYAVYDGHNGDSCSTFLKKHFHNNLRELIRASNLAESKNFFADLCKTIQDAIIYTDLNYYDNETNFSIHHGSTCVALFFVGNKVLCCNLGDSISVLVRNNKKINLSRDFKPTREKEKGRIMKKNGWISSNHRLLGYISVSRSFGDWSFKDPKKQHELKRNVSKALNFDEYLMSNRAEFRIFEIDPNQDDYIIIASDGIFQHSNNGSVFDTINKYLSLEKNENSDIKNIPNVIDNVRLDIINNIYGDTSKTRSTIDNMTLILIDLQNNK